MLHRTFKQIVIAIIFFGFWAGISGLVVWATYDPPPVPTPTPKIAKNLEVLETLILSTGLGKADLVGIVNNPNSDAGSVEFEYEFVISAAGEQAPEIIVGQSFILPGDRKIITVLNREVPPGASVALTIKNTQWNFVGADFRAPNIVLVNKPTRIIVGPEADTFQLKGLLANQGDVNFKRVEVTAVGLNDKGKIIGVSNTFLGSLKSLERREFTAQWPLQKGQEVNDIRVRPEVNIFLPDAIQREEGLQDNRDYSGN